MNNYYKDIEQLVKVKSDSDKRNYSALLGAGVRAQEEKLKENEHKRGFEDIDVYYAFDRIIDELKELRIELFQMEKTDHDIDFVRKREQYDLLKTRSEAADIANFAHMIILKCDQELRRPF